MKIYAFLFQGFTFDCGSPSLIVAMKESFEDFARYLYVLIATTHLRDDGLGELPAFDEVLRWSDLQEKMPTFDDFYAFITKNAFLALDGIDPSGEDQRLYWEHDSRYVLYSVKEDMPTLSYYAKEWEENVPDEERAKHKGTQAFSIKRRYSKEKFLAWLKMQAS